MTFASNKPTAWLLTIALHALLLAALVQRPPQPAAPAANGPAIQWLLPLRPAAPHSVTQAAGSARPVAVRPQPARKRTTEDRAIEGQPVREGEPASATVDVAPASEFAPAGEPVSAADPLATQPALGTLMGRTTYGAGKLDHELRGGKLARLNKEDAALRASVDAAFRDAVARKWYEPASLQEISTPSDRVRVYKMKTLMGTVCISVPDPSLEKRYNYLITNCPREK